MSDASLNQLTPDQLQQLRAAAATATPAGAAAATPIPAGTGSYVGQQNGGVTSGNRSVWDVITGQNRSQVNPALIASLPDAGDQQAVADAQANFQRQHDAWAMQLQNVAAQMKGLSPFDPKFKAGMDQLNQLKAAEPQAPDQLAIQNQSDRNRLLNEATSAYQPLIASQLAVATGQAPSAAESTYRTAADDASRRAYGLAASAQGTGGQRAALFQAAMGQQAQVQQQAANDAAKIRAQEINSAGAAANSSLQGLTGIYGMSNLYGGTLDVQKFNADSRNTANQVNSGIQQNNANNSTSLAKSALSTAAQAAEHAA